MESANQFKIGPVHRLSWNRVGIIAAVACLSFSLVGCYSLRPSSGGGQAEFDGSRETDPSDIALPDGYHIQVIAKGLTFPTGACFDDQGRLHVVESGYSYGEVWTTPRLLRIEQDGGNTQIAAGARNGPWTGVAFHEGAFFVAEGGVLEGGRILRITPEGDIKAIVDGLPSFGDHHTDGPVVSPDGWIYFGQGTASNSGVIGEDNLKFGWLKRHPEFHDVPGHDIKLAGRNFTTKSLLSASKGGKVQTGAFLPFGTASQTNQTIRGQVKSSGAILRVRPDGSGLQLVAWGFRNPFGLSFSQNGKLYATDNGYDDRGSRPVWGTADVLWEVRQGTWYGWPDYSAGEPLTMKKFKPPGKPQPQFLLAEHPNRPPQPVARFAVHSSADGLDVSRSEQFGYVGEAFVALLGDEAPAVGKVLHPAGFKVVRVNLETGTVEDFAVNKGKQNGPASKIGTRGLERPVAARFNPSGDALYVVDFGVMLHDRKGAKPQPGTGVVWKIAKGGQR
jgi:glucose/arabinose dehydrogenase